MAPQHSQSVIQPAHFSAELAQRLANLSAPWSCVLFDMDGTLTDSAPGIMKRISETITHMGFPSPSQAALFEMIGPPLLDTFRDAIGMSEEEAQTALVYQRSLANERGPGAGTTVYPGIPQLLQELKANNLPISLATSKAEQQAMLGLEFFDLAQFFDDVTGASADEVRSSKTDVIIESLKRLNDQGFDISRPVLVGDRIYDINGAAELGIPTIIVEWGYGNPKECQQAHSSVRTPELLLEALTARHTGSVAS